MGRGVWNTIKHSKTFYISIYRKGTTLVIISLCINLLLSGVTYYVYTHAPEPAYYATSGVALPIQLTALDAPNNTSTFLLPPDPINDAEKSIPQ